MLYRKIEKKLNEYYKNKDEKILIINGARQIGKTFIIRETAKKAFKNYLEINLSDDFNGDKIFEKVRTAESFYLAVSSMEELNNIDDTIIFLDEIQVYPHLISLLKTLKKDNKYRYICSGSLLGLTLRHSFIPMGSIEEIKMYPLDFEEFLIANNVSKSVIEYLHKCFVEHSDINLAVHQIILSKFKQYLIYGGLPEVVNSLKDKNIIKARSIQKQIYNFYLDDASKYETSHSLKIRRIYENLTSYMTNKVKRIRFNKIEDKQNISIREYEDEFDYLVHSGCCLSVNAISNPVFPLNLSLGKNLIKLYYNDVGILSMLLFDNAVQPILNNDVGLNLGSLYETAALMELKSHEKNVFYFDSKKVGEVDFLINDYNNLSILPIEIKSGNDQTSYRAIPKLVSKDGPYKAKTGFVFGNKNTITEKDNLVTLPIYLIMFI